MKYIKINPPKSWSDLVKIKNKIPFALPESVRFKEDLKFYRLYSKYVPQPIRLQILKAQIGKNIKIIKNNFPYRRLFKNIPYVTHYCFWSQKGKLTPEFIEEKLKKHFSKKQYFWFENAEFVKSIPEIWHCHVLVKEK